MPLAIYHFCLVRQYDVMPCGRELGGGNNTYHGPKMNANTPWEKHGSGICPKTRHWGSNIIPFLFVFDKLTYILKTGICKHTGRPLAMKCRWLGSGPLDFEPRIWLNTCEVKTFNLPTPPPYTDPGGGSYKGGMGGKISTNRFGWKKRLCVIVMLFLCFTNCILSASVEANYGLLWARKKLEK